MQIPVALTIAGSDSGGGAGIQADLKTFASLGVHGTSVITCLTAQNPRRVLAIKACPPKFLRAQLDALFSELPPQAIKTGMLYSASIIREAVAFLSGVRVSVVVDPVMIATSGGRLLQPSALRALKSGLLPLAELITPNLDECAVLVGKKITTPALMRDAARALHEHHGVAALVKGGHLRGVKSAVDIFFDGRNEWLLESPFIRGINTHGTGCTFSAAITAYRALGVSLSNAVIRGKEYVTQAIRNHHRVGPHQVLNSFWN